MMIVLIVTMIHNKLLNKSKIATDTSHRLPMDEWQTCQTCCREYLYTCFHCIADDQSSLPEIQEPPDPVVQFACAKCGCTKQSDACLRCLHI